MIFYYAATIFHDAGESVSDALVKIVSIGVVNLVFTVDRRFTTVDHIGRRKLMLLIGFWRLAHTARSHRHGSSHTAVTAASSCALLGNDRLSTP